MKYDFGNTIRVRPDAPSKFYPNRIGDVVGMYPTPGQEFGLPDEEVMAYTIEFGDGSAIEIPEQFLDPYTEIDES